jgi:tetratricopeptide (TPR) repeat protein
MPGLILPRWRRIGLWIGISVATVLLVGTGSFVAYHAYCQWQAERSISLARSFVETNNLPEGILKLRSALRQCPDHLEARRAIASLLEASRSPEALVHRQRLMDLQPQSLEPKLTYARTALLFGKPEEAAKVLDQFRGANRKTSQFLELRAELFLARGRADLALEAYRELLERDPEDRRNQVKLITLQLQTGLEPDRESARKDLESLASDEEFGLIAVRALARDALRRQDYPAALSWSERACEKPSAEFSDRMLRLEALFATKSPGYDRLISDLEKSAFEDPQSALEMGRWKVTWAGPQTAATWLESAPDGVRSEPDISALLAECYCALNRWSDLETLALAGAWQALEPLRLAFLARAEAGQRNVKKSEQTWELAVATAERQPALLMRLLAIARADKRDVRQVLWIIAERDARNVSARRELYQAYWQERNADGMLRMMELVLRENPNDRAAKYSVANLLLATGRQIDRAGRLAKELYEDDPRALGNAALYAFFLHLQGNPEKGVDLLDSRDDVEQLGGEGAAYYALVLSACGRRDEARRALAAVDRQLLLPELRAHLDRVFGAVSTNTTSLPAQE